MAHCNPDRNPCVQGSIRSLGFNFTDWFAPFFSVRILTRKVAFAEPLYCDSSRTSTHDFSLLRTDEMRSQAAVGDSEDAHSVKSSANDFGRAPCAVARSAKSDT